MTPRQRVLDAIAHREPDRVPIDQGSMRSTGVMAIAYSRFRKYLGIREGATYVYDLIQQLARQEQWFLDRYHVDVIDIGRAFEPPGYWQPWTLPDGSPAMAPAWFRPEWEDGGLVVRHPSGTPIGRMPRSSLYIDQCHWPLSGPDGLDASRDLSEALDYVTWNAIPTAPYDQPMTDERIAEIGRTARHLYETTGYALSLSIGCSLFECCQFLLGMQNLYLYLGSEKSKLAGLLDRITELHLENLHRRLPAVRGYVQILVVGDDLGMQRGPQISREMYREFFLPRHRRIYRCARELSGAHIFMHCCGGVYQLIPDLIEAGVEILNPVQTTARNMEPERLKREFGRDLTFWGGGCDTQNILIHGTPAGVRDDVRRRIDIFGPGGGYVWNQIHNVMSDVPPENFEAMLEAAYG